MQSSHALPITSGVGTSREERGEELELEGGLKGSRATEPDPRMRFDAWGMESYQAALPDL